MNHLWVRRSLQTTCDVKIGMFSFWSRLSLVPPITVIPGSLFGSIGLIVGGFSPFAHSHHDAMEKREHTRTHTLEHTLSRTRPRRGYCGGAGTLLAPIGLKLFISSTAPGFIYLFVRLEDFKMMNGVTRSLCTFEDIRNQESVSWIRLSLSTLICFIVGVCESRDRSV